MKFRDLHYFFGDLINSEGSILKIVMNIDEEDFTNERLFISGLCTRNKGRVYCKVNETALLWYFQGRITTKELFLIRNDETFYVEIGGEITEHYFGQDFEYQILETLECGNKIYPNIPLDNKLNDPFKEVLEAIKKGVF